MFFLHSKIRQNQYMKLHSDIEKAIYEQINHEFFSAYAYLAMAGWFEHESLNGFAG